MNASETHFAPPALLSPFASAAARWRVRSRLTALAAPSTLALAIALLSGCHSNGEPIVDIEPAAGPLGSTIMLPVIRLSPPQSPIRQAAIDPSVTRQQTLQLMDDIVSRRKTIATLSAADRERLKVFLAAQKSDKLKALGRNLD